MNDWIIGFGMGFGAVVVGVALGLLWWYITRSVSNGMKGMDHDE